MDKILLGINTASFQTEICLIDLTKNILVAKKNYNANNNEAELLIPEINNLLNVNNVNFADLNSIAVINGPGSFVSLRVGVIVANTLINNLKNLNSYVFSLFDLLDGVEHEILLNDEKFKTALYNLNLVFAGGNQIFWNENIYAENDSKLKLSQNKLSKNNRVIEIIELNELKNKISKLTKESKNSLNINIDGPKEFKENLINELQNFDFNYKINSEFDFSAFILQLLKFKQLEHFQNKENSISPNYIKEASISIKK